MPTLCELASCIQLPNKKPAVMRRIPCWDLFYKHMNSYSRRVRGSMPLHAKIIYFYSDPGDPSTLHKYYDGDDLRRRGRGRTTMAVHEIAQIPNRRKRGFVKATRATLGRYIMPQNKSRRLKFPSFASQDLKGNVVGTPAPFAQAFSYCYFSPSPSYAWILLFLRVVHPALGC